MVLKQSLPVWRVHVSPFACNRLDGVTVLSFFSLKHCTLPITLEMGKINNYLLHVPSFIFPENTGDDISETLNLNIFWWSMHPEPLDLERVAP